MTDPWKVLDISHPESSDGILLKKAYHKALLAAHPDKNKLYPYSVDQIRIAYLTLVQQQQDVTTSYAVIDLDDFDYDESTMTYAHPCRCGHGYRITDTDLEQSRDVIQCDGCSLLVRVTYEIAQDT